MGLVVVLLVGSLLTVAGAAISGFLILFALRFAFRFVTGSRGTPREVAAGAPASEAGPSFMTQDAPSAIGASASTPRRNLLPRLESGSAAWLGSACLGGLLLQELATSLLNSDADALSLFPVEAILCAAIAAWLVLRRSVWAAGLTLVVIGWELLAELEAVARGEDGAFWSLWMGALLWAAIISFSSLRAARRYTAQPSEVMPTSTPSVARAQTFGERISEARRNRVTASDILTSKNPVVVSLGVLVIVLLVGARMLNITSHFAPHPAIATATAPASAPPPAPSAVPISSSPTTTAAPSAATETATGAPPQPHLRSPAGLSVPIGFTKGELNTNEFVRVSANGSDYDVGEDGLWQAFLKAGYTPTVYESHVDNREIVTFLRGADQVVLQVRTSGANFAYISEAVVGGETYTDDRLLNYIESLLHLKLEAS